MTRASRIPMATGITTPIRLQVRPARSDKRDLEISISAGVAGTRSRTTLWSMECHPSWWWEFGSLIIDEAIILAIEGVVPTEFPRRLDKVVKEVYQQMVIPLDL